MHLYNPFFVIVAMCGIFLLQLNTQILRVAVNDSSSSYEDLLTKLDVTTPEAGRVQSIMLTLYKCLQGMAPPYLRAYIQERRVSDYNLRGQNKLEIPHVKTTTSGLRSFKYFAAHAWNDLADNIRMSETLATFKRDIIDYVLLRGFVVFSFPSRMSNCRS